MARVVLVVVCAVLVLACVTALPADNELLKLGDSAVDKIFDDLDSLDDAPLGQSSPKGLVAHDEVKAGVPGEKRGEEREEVVEEASKHAAPTTALPAQPPVPHHAEAAAESAQPASVRVAEASGSPAPKEEHEEGQAKAQAAEPVAAEPVAAEPVAVKTKLGSAKAQAKQENSGSDSSASSASQSGSESEESDNEKGTAAAPQAATPTAAKALPKAPAAPPAKALGTAKVQAKQDSASSASSSYSYSYSESEETKHEEDGAPASHAQAQAPPQAVAKAPAAPPAKALGTAKGQAKQDSASSASSSYSYSYSESEETKHEEDSGPATKAPTKMLGIAKERAMREHTGARQAASSSEESQSDSEEEGGRPRGAVKLVGKAMNAKRKQSDSEQSSEEGESRPRGHSALLHVGHSGGGASNAHWFADSALSDYLTSRILQSQAVAGQGVDKQGFVRDMVSNAMALVCSVECGVGSAAEKASALSPQLHQAVLVAVKELEGGSMCHLCRRGGDRRHAHHAPAPAPAPSAGAGAGVASRPSHHAHRLRHVSTAQTHISLEQHQGPKAVQRGRRHHKRQHDGAAENEANMYSVVRPPKGGKMMEGFWERFDQVKQEGGSVGPKVLEGLAANAQSLRDGDAGAVGGSDGERWLGNDGADHLPPRTDRPATPSDHRREDGAKPHQHRHPLAHGHRHAAKLDDEDDKPAIDVARFNALRHKKMGMAEGKATVASAGAQAQAQRGEGEGGRRVLGSPLVVGDVAESDAGGDDDDALDTGKFDRLMKRHLERVADRVEKAGPVGDGGMRAPEDGGMDESPVSQKLADVVDMLRAINPGLLAEDQKQELRQLSHRIGALPLKNPSKMGAAEQELDDILAKLQAIHDAHDRAVQDHADKIAQAIKQFEGTTMQAQEQPQPNPVQPVQMAQPVQPVQPVQAAPSVTVEDFALAPEALLQEQEGLDYSDVLVPVPADQLPDPSRQA